MLVKESKGNARGRGLIIDDKKGLQTFEFFLPKAIRKVFDEKYSSEANQAITNTQTYVPQSNDAVAR